MSKHTATINLRDLKQNLNQLRSTHIPGNIFSPGDVSTAISIENKVFIKLYNQVGESGVAYLKLNKKEIPVMIEEVQWHPVKDTPIHVAFKVVDLNEKTEALIPVELIGELDIPEAVLVTVRNEVQVRALPTDLPEKFVVNVEGLTEIGQSITLSDLDYDRSKVEIVVGEEGEDAPVVLVQEVREEPEEEEEEVLEVFLTEPQNDVSDSDPEKEDDSSKKKR